MAEDADKRYDPTPHHLEQARKKGQLAKSQDLTGFLTLITSLSVIFFGWTAFIKDFENLFEATLSTFDFTEALALMGGQLLKWILIATIPVGIIGVLSHIVQNAVVFAPESITPKAERISPASNFKNVFSLESLVTAIKSIITMAIVVVVIYMGVKRMGMITVGATIDITPFVRTIFLSILPLIVWFVGMAIIDTVFSQLRHKHKLKMSVQEMKEEMKQTEGDPLVKSKQRAFRNALLRGSIEDNVAEADVVIVNPVHLAIAIKYDQEVSAAPYVTAKGARKMALKIKEHARDHKIPIVENPPVAQLLFRFVKVGAEIPPKFYEIVAEILAYVINKNGDKNAA